MHVIPTILASDKVEFERQLISLAKISKRLQIDVADGVFVSNKTLPFPEIIEFFSKNAHLFVDNIFDFHLMIKSWEPELGSLARLKSYIKINLVLIHNQVYYASESNNFKTGLVINPEDDISREIFFPNLKAIQIMTVHPGKQGSPFLESNLEKVQQLRELNFRGEIILDGGINEKSALQIVSSGYTPDAVGVGSYLTVADNPEKNYHHLKSLLSSI